MSASPGSSASPKVRAERDVARRGARVQSVEEGLIEHADARGGATHDKSTQVEVQRNAVVVRIRRCLAVTRDTPSLDADGSL